MPIAPGTRLGPYLVQESIGQGAMGVVYRAYHEQLERTGAVKVLQALSPDEETTARFRREAQAIAHMRHSNVLNVFDFGQYDGTPYMIVEYVEGGSLAGRLKRGRLGPDDALNYLRGIGSALDYAHSLGIVHRDVKPANVLIGPNDTPILADFGLAKLLQSSSIKSITGVTTGTPAYMAPEQVTGGQIGPAADRYSLAVMAFEMLSGSLPFDDAGVLEVLYAHVHREPPKPSTRNEQLSGRVDAVVLRGLAKDPADRWESCDAFVTALEQVLQPESTPQVGRTVAFAPPMPAPPDAATPKSVAVAPITSVPSPQTVARRLEPSTTVLVQPAPKEKSKRRLIWLGAAGLILLLLIGVTAAFLDTRAPQLNLTPQVAARGQLIRVTAINVPAHQVGEIQLHSVLKTFPFQAGSKGNVDQRILVPGDVEVGEHRVDICWNGVCRASKTLRVVAGGVAEVSPIPGTSPSPGSTPSTTPSPTPGKPRSSPSSNPTHASSPSPSPRPSTSPLQQPSPTPTSNPCPTPPAPAGLTASPTTVVGGSRVTLTGADFTPNKTVTLKYYKGNATAPSSTFYATAGCGGGFTIAFTTAGGIARTDTVTACDSTNRCATPVKLTILL